MSNLFQRKSFISHSGIRLPWKIECDNLTDEDWAWAAEVTSKKIDFQSVYGIPRGGLRFAHFLQQYCTEKGKYKLIVDDVYTTGGSIEDAKKQFTAGQEGTHPYFPYIGVVMFTRAPTVPMWIYPIWKYGF